MIDIEAIAPDPGREQVLDLTVRALNPGRDSCVSDELAPDRPECLATNVKNTVLAT